MAVGDLLTGPFQLELRGVLMDSFACDGLVIGEGFLDGLGVPGTRDNDKFRPQQHGLVASPQYLEGRVLRWPVSAGGSTAAAVRTAMANLGSAMAPVRDNDADLVVELAFTLADAAQKYLVYGKPQRAAFKYRALVASREDPSGSFTDPGVCEFLATDPRVYSLLLQSLTTGTGSSSGGLAFPFAFPFSFGTFTAALLDCTNGGTFPTYPVLTLTAGGSGLSGIRILNNTTSKEWSITLTMAAGDVLVVDMAEGTALLNGASRDNLVNRPPSEWWQLEPGVNTVQFVGTGAGSTLKVEWRDAWLL